MIKSNRKLEQSKYLINAILEAEKKWPNNMDLGHVFRTFVHKVKDHQVIDDEELYLIATKEVEGSDRNDALWAKCMATQMGDETKAKYSYVNIRVAMLKQEEKDKAEQRKTLEENFFFGKLPFLNST